MKKNLLVLLFIAALVFPLQLMAQAGADVFRQEGIASWYGREFEGRPTASGEIFDASKLTAAHPTLPFGTMVVVTNQHNNKSVTVRINDRGPFVAARVIDVSRAAAEQLDMIVTGTAPVAVQSIDRIAVNTPPVSAPAAVHSIPVTQVQPVQQPVIVAAPVQPVHVQQQPVVAAAPVQTVPQQPVVVAAPVQPVQQPVVVAAPITVAATPVAAAPITVAAMPVAAAPAVITFRLSPEIPIAYEKTYRLQVGSFKVARNAVETFERLKNAGLNPAYERFEETDGEFFRVVLAGVPGGDLQQTTAVLGAAGFREALIREER